MKPIKRIEGTNSKSLTLALHADLNARLYSLVSKKDPEKLKLEQKDLDEWKRIIGLEQDLAKSVADSETTSRMNRKHSERNKIITSIFAEVRAARISPIDSRGQAARRLYPIVRAYRGMQRESFAEETAHIEGFLMDIRKADAMPDATTLGLQTLITMLEQANNDFRSIRGERSLTSVTDRLPNSRVVRRSADEMLKAIIFHIETAHLLSKDDEQKDIAMLINEMNQIIIETKTANRQRIVQKKNSEHAKKKKDGSPSDKSKDGKKHPSKPDDKSKDDKQHPSNPDDKSPDGGKKDPDPNPKKPEREEDPGEDQA